MIGEANLFTIAAAIGVTGWMAVAKMVRSEMKQIRRAEYILAAKSAGGKFFYLLWNHYMPNFMPAILFMIVTNLASAIAVEATLSFLGLGLPAEVLSWGSLLSLSQKAMLSGAWWQMVIPGAFLVVTLVCITEIGEYLRKAGGREVLL
jgi:peptide/nickel transport system permease protein